MTIKEISKLAGVSTCTVSNVINNKRESVSDEVREKVWKIIRETGYVPNGIAKSLRKQRSNTIGVLTEDITHFHVPEIVGEINRYAEQMNIHVILSNFSRIQNVAEKEKAKILNADSKEINDAIDLMLEAKVDGIIYIAWQDRIMKQFIKNINIPFVYVYCVSEMDRISSVSYDNVSGITDVLDRVLALKHRKIALLKGGDESCYPSALRFQVYLRKLKENGIPYREEYVKTGDWNFDDGKMFYRELMALPDPPTVIVSLNDEMAAGVIAESMNTDRRVLDEVSVVGFNGVEFCSFLCPTLATVRLPLKQIGHEAVKQLILEIQNKECEHKHLVLPCEFQEGVSLRENPFA